MMQENNLTWDEKLNASKLEKDLLQRTVDLNAQVETNNNVVTTLRENHDQLIKRCLAMEEAFNILNTRYNLLHIQVAGRITQEQRTSLLKMLDSPDSENHMVAYETINNLIEDGSDSIK